MISVVIPAYNSSKTIIPCIKSVLHQTRIDLIDRIIVVDDGSKDNTVDAIYKQFGLEHPLIHVIKKENGGASTARNVGIRASESRWIALLDSDDVWSPRKIELQWKKIKQYPTIRFIGCDINKKDIHWGKKVDNTLYKLNLNFLLIKMWPPTPTVLIHSDVFKSIGLFDEKMRYAEDGDLWTRIAVQYPLYYIPKSYVIAGRNKMEFGESGLSANLKGMYNGYINILKKLKRKKAMNKSQYLLLRYYYYLKYIRRIIITKQLKKKEK